MARSGSTVFYAWLWLALWAVPCLGGLSSSKFLDLLLAEPKPSRTVPPSALQQPAPPMDSRQQRELRRQQKKDAKAEKRMMRELRSLAFRAAHENVNVQDKQGMTLLMHAVKFPNREATDYLLEFRPDLKVRDQHGRTVFDYENDAGNGALGEYVLPILTDCLLGRRYDEFRDWCGWGAKPHISMHTSTLFTRMLQDGAFDCFVAVYKGGKLENKQTESGSCLMEILLRYGDAAAVEVGCDCLGGAMGALSQSRRSSLIFLLMSRGDVDVVKSYAHTVGLIPGDAKAAVRHSSPEVVSWVLSQQKEESLTEPLFEAARRGNPRVLEAVLEAGADINEQNDRKETVLMHAALSANEAVVRMVLEKMAAERRSAVDAVGRSAVYYARCCGRRNIEQMLVDAGVKPTEKDSL